mmetsp:Transcript_91979/g.259865  ORF Transcript_91979/g.259865 Transcript_91979/m.259865 type:complete len:218 (-) Transcript_91979:246-899(-)
MGVDPPPTAPRAATRPCCTTSNSSNASCSSRSAALKRRGQRACNWRHATTPPLMSCCSTRRASGWHTRSLNVSSAKRTRICSGSGTAASASARLATSSRNASASNAVATMSTRPPNSAASEFCCRAGPVPAPPPSDAKQTWHRSIKARSRVSCSCTYPRWARDHAHRHCEPCTAGGGSGGGGHHSSRRRFFTPSPERGAHVTAMTCVSQSGRRIRLR